MTQYNTLNVKLCYLQLNKLKLGMRNNTKVTLKMLSNVVGDFNGENNFLHKLLVANTQVAKISKSFANNSPGNLKLSKTLLREIEQSGGFLGRLLGSLLKLLLFLIGNILNPIFPGLFDER